MQRELTSPEGGFYSSIDADSEGEEGKFYVWTKSELQQILGEKSDLIISYYNVSEKGNWEDTKNILFKTNGERQAASGFNITETELEKQLSEAKELLLNFRMQRLPPALDDKILTSWNALMLKAYTDAYRAFDNSLYLDIALKNAGFILANMRSSDNRLLRNYKNGRTSINAFLDDYAFIVEAFIGLYQATFDETWLTIAKQIADYSIIHFYEQQNGMFYYTSDIDPALIARKMDISDNVIPSSNSVMAKNLFVLGHYFDDGDYIDMSDKMLNNVKPYTIKGETYYGNWDMLMAWFVDGINEVAIVGKDFDHMRKEMDAFYLPNVLLSGGEQEGTLPLLTGKLKEGITTLYVCRNKVCKLPVTDVKEAIKLIQNR